MQNLTSDGITTFGFDLENRMLSASKAGMSAVYTYDPLGRRVAKSVNGVGTATLFDGDSEIGDLEGGVHSLELAGRELGGLPAKVGQTAPNRLRLTSADWN